MFYNSFFLSGSSGGPHGSRWLIFDWRQMRDSFLFCFWNNNHNRSARRRNPCPPPLVKTRRQGHTQKKSQGTKPLTRGKQEDILQGVKGHDAAASFSLRAKTKKKLKYEKFQKFELSRLGGGSLSNKTMTSHAVNYLIVIELRFFVDFSMGGGWISVGWNPWVRLTRCGTLSNEMHRGDVVIGARTTRWVLEGAGRGFWRGLEGGWIETVLFSPPD